MRISIHPADPVIGVPPHDHDQGVLDVQTRGTALISTARPFTRLNTFVDTILKPVLPYPETRCAQTQQQGGKGRRGGEKQTTKERVKIKTDCVSLLLHATRFTGIDRTIKSCDKHVIVSIYCLLPPRDSRGKREPGQAVYSSFVLYT